jgi:DNA/RNA-binding domain of Phe-tRNA-synthetase-like protein
VIISSEVAGFALAESSEIAPVRVVERDDALDAPLQAAAARMRTADEAPDITAAVRAMYRRAGIDPTKTRPSSEALLRRVRRGEALPRINSLVDVINWCSLETRLPFGLYDLDQVHGAVTLRLGHQGEGYAGIRKDTVHLGGRLTLADDRGPFGNPTSDSARTMVTTATTRALVVIFVPAAVDRATGRRALELTLARVREFCQDHEAMRP